MTFNNHTFSLINQCKNKENLIIVVFGNSEYRKVIMHWLLLIRKLNITNYLIVSLDEKLYKLLNYFGYNTLKSEFSGSLDQLWTYRSKIIKKILEFGVNVIHSDADAFWLKNPIPKFFSESKYDILASQGTIWPEEILNKWGFVLCSGLVYYKSNPKVIEIFDNIINRSMEYKDDQKAFNTILYEINIKWIVNNIENYLMSNNGKSFKCFKSIVRGENNSISVGLLPHVKFQRMPENDNDIYVAHYLSSKNEKSKIKILDNLKCDKYLVEDMLLKYDKKIM